VLFAYDLRNEPEVPWDSPELNRRWNLHLQKKYRTAGALKQAWNLEEEPTWGKIAAPSGKDALGSRELLEYQRFREDIADAWTHAQAVAIKQADPGALVTVGLIQWSVPTLLPAGVRHYAAFNPARQARLLDFLEIHFYPLARGAYEYKAEDEVANLAYLESLVREAAKPGKPLVLGEFGWYGGGKPNFDRGSHPAATEEQQAEYCRKAVETAAGFVVGWLNWGFYDQPEARDVSEMTGLLKPDGTLKAWGRTFAELAARYSGRRIESAGRGPRPELDWEACLTSAEAGRRFHQAYVQMFEENRVSEAGGHGRSRDFQGGRSPGE
jgi:hypothetical protein